VTFKVRRTGAARQGCKWSPRWHVFPTRDGISSATRCHDWGREGQRQRAGYEV